MRRVLLAIVLLLVSVPAAAQERGQIGVTLAFPAAIGIVWHASDAIAVRPDFSFSYTTTKSEAPATFEGSSWSFATGIGALFYMGAPRDNVRTYLTPRFAYTRTNAENNPNVPAASRQHSNAYQYSGAFGVQYTPTRRFSLFAEAGLSYTKTDSFYTPTVSSGVVVWSGKTTGTQLGTRTGVGVILYFD